jgi:CspA family cold shock protein
MQNLNEGQKIEFEVVSDRKTGKSSADNLRAV